MFACSIKVGQVMLFGFALICLFFEDGDTGLDF